MFIPRKVIFEKGSLEYELARTLYDTFQKDNRVEILELSPNKISSALQGETIHERHKDGKRTLVIGTKKSLTFQSCKPSAHYQLPLVSGCMGACEYCYLYTQLGDKPYVKIHVNVDEIIHQAQKYIQERSPEITVFEGAATSDPVPVEPYTNALKKCIEFFGNNELSRFRFVTKYNDIDSLLHANHKGNTQIRFSLNTNRIIQDYEHYTPSAEKRIEAAAKLSAHGYPIGFLIAPVFLYDNWKKDYKELIDQLHASLPKDAMPIEFEIITHRYTTKAKNIINQVFPQTTLPMKDEERRFQFGQFGYGKYVYPKEEMQTVKDFFTTELHSQFRNINIKYII